MMPRQELRIKAKHAGSIYTILLHGESPVREMVHRSHYFDLTHCYWPVQERLDAKEPGLIESLRDRENLAFDNMVIELALPNDIRLGFCVTKAAGGFDFQIVRWAKAESSFGFYHPMAVRDKTVRFLDEAKVKQGLIDTSSPDTIEQVMERQITWFQLLRICLGIINHPNEHVRTKVKLSDKLKVERAGGHFRGDRYVIIQDFLKPPIPQQRSSSGSSPKCEHTVKGHWRSLKSGKTVWVRSHQRGDATLGSTTSSHRII